jgi:hypothetical protein
MFAESKLKHEQKPSKDVLVSPIPVQRANENAITVFFPMKLWATSQVIGRQLPVHGGLIIDFEEPEFLQL